MSESQSKKVSISADNSRRQSLERDESESLQGDEGDRLLSSQSVPSSPRFRGSSLSARLLGPARNFTSRISSPRRSVFGDHDDIYAATNKRRQYDDEEFENEMSLSGGNGVRVHYSSYTTIDWVHDSIKESSRLRRLARIKGIRGYLLTSWDRFQSWLIVTIVGILVALIAGGIVMSEAVLFDLKEGYCEKDWRLAKRFCCPFAQGPDYPDSFLLMPSNSTPTWSYSSSFKAGKSDPTKGLLTGMGNQFLAGWAGPVAGSPAWKNLAKSSFASSLSSTSDFNIQNEECPGWITWGEKFTSDGKDSWLADYGMYILVAICWASVASLLTIYLTSSELYTSQKNSAPSVNSLYTSQGSTSAGDDKKDSTPSNGNAESSSASSSNATANSSTSGLPSTAADERSPLLPKPKASPDSALPSKVLSQLAQEQISSQALPPRKVLYFGSGSGIPEVKCILSGFVIHGYLGFWTLFTKAVGLTFSVASGLSLGKEGPFVQIASCVGNIVCRVFPAFENNEAKRREILSCACAAGVAVAFGAPVGGVLFSLEEVSYFFPSSVMFRSFFCAMVAAATLRAIDPFGTGKIVLFQVTYDKDWHFQELPFFILIGVFGGLYGAYFTKLNMLWSKNVRAKTWMARKPVLEVIMITSLTVFVSFFNDYTRMGGTELIADLFAECHEHESLDGLCISSPSQIRPLITAIAWTCLAKGVLTIVTFGIKLPAGIFIPTLAVGACFGRIVGLLVQYVQWTQPDLRFFDWCSSSDTSCIVPGVYAMVGAAATLSGTTRTTVSLAVIMFELTGTLTYSVPVMLALLVAKTIADALEHKGIYDLVIEFSGLPFLDNKINYTWDGVSVRDAMDTGIELIYLENENTVKGLRSKLERLALGNGYTDGGFPIVVKDESSHHRGGKGNVKMVGYIAAAELEHALISIMIKDPSLDPETAVATFKNIPYVLNQSGSGSVDGLEDIRESMILGQEPLDLSIYVDKAPITVQTHSPLELVHQYFTSLGVKTLIVTDEKGLYKGVIFKKTYLAFLESLDKKGH